MVGDGKLTSSSISKRVKPPYLDCSLPEGRWGFEESVMVESAMMMLSL